MVSKMIVFIILLTILYIEKKALKILNKTNLVGETLVQGKNDYKKGVMVHALFLVAKIIYYLSINEYGNIEKHRVFKDFADSQRLLETNFSKCQKVIKLMLNYT